MMKIFVKALTIVILTISVYACATTGPRIGNSFQFIDQDKGNPICIVDCASEVNNNEAQTQCIEYGEIHCRPALCINITNCRIYPIIEQEKTTETIKTTRISFSTDRPLP